MTHVPYDLKHFAQLSRGPILTHPKRAYQQRGQTLRSPLGANANPDHASGTVSNRYDEAGWLVATAFHPSASSAIDLPPTAFSHYPAGQVSNVVSAAGSNTVLLGPSDRLDTLIQTPIENPQSSIAFSYAYCDWNGLVSAVTNSAGLSVEYGYDVMDRPTNIAWRAADGTLLRGFEMAYNALGMVTNVTHADSSRRSYAFDSLDRLVGERQLAPDGTPVREGAYAYDLVGNRTSTTIDGTTETYTLGIGNRLATYGANGYTHNDAGCVTRIARAGQPALDLSWDAQYRLTAVSTNGVVVEAYGYDPLGRRAWTTTYPLPLGEGQGEGVKTLHMYVGMHCVADLDADGTVLRSYTYGPGVDNLLALTDHTTATPTVLFALTDHLGTVHALADASGAIVESYRYDAWGNVLGVWDDAGLPTPDSRVGNRFLFQGREHSFATGLTHFRARWYDPETGRWLRNDPIGISGGLNQYVFCDNDPVNYVDPDGLDAYIVVREGHMGLLIDAGPGRYRSYDFSMGERGNVFGEAARYQKGTPGKVTSRSYGTDHAEALLKDPKVTAIFRVKGTDDAAMIKETIRQVLSPPNYGEEDGVCTQRAFELVEHGSSHKFPKFENETRAMIYSSQPMIKAIEEHIKDINKNYEWIKRVK